MAIFEILKKWAAFGHRQPVENKAGTPQGPDQNSLSPSFPDISEAEEGERYKRVSLLTPREYELYRLLLEGFTLKESAKQLSIKYSTANTQMTGIYKKLGIKSRAELIINYRGIKGNGT